MSPEDTPTPEQAAVQDECPLRFSWKVHAAGGCTHFVLPGGLKLYAMPRRPADGTRWVPSRAQAALDACRAAPEAGPNADARLRAMAQEQADRFGEPVLLFDEPPPSPVNGDARRAPCLVLASQSTPDERARPHAVVTPTPKAQ